MVGLDICWPSITLCLRLRSSTTRRPITGRNSLPSPHLPGQPHKRQGGGQRGREDVLEQWAHSVVLHRHQALFKEGKGVPAGKQQTTQCRAGEGAGSPQAGAAASSSPPFSGQSRLASCWHNWRARQPPSGPLAPRSLVARAEHHHIHALDAAAIRQAGSPVSMQGHQVGRLDDAAAAAAAGLAAARQAAVADVQRLACQRVLPLAGAQKHPAGGVRVEREVGRGCSRCREEQAAMHGMVLCVSGAWCMAIPVTMVAAEQAHRLAPAFATSSAMSTPLLEAPSSSTHSPLQRKAVGKSLVLRHSRGALRPSA